MVWCRERLWWCRAWSMYLHMVQRQKLLHMVQRQKLLHMEMYKERCKERCKCCNHMMVELPHDEPQEVANIRGQPQVHYSLQHDLPSMQ